MTRRLRRAAARLRLSRAYLPLRAIRERRAAARWERAGRPIPPPASVKRVLLAEHARRYGLRTLVETGTHRGDTVAGMLWRFDRIVSIELDAALAGESLRRLGHYRHVTLLQGDSASLLPGVVAQLEEPALFWLDAHYSGPGTGRAATDTPVLAELGCILAAPHDHVVLIDDARLFVGEMGYPSLDELRTLVAAPSRVLRVEVADDVIRLVP